MKRFIRPQIIVVGATVVALVALSTVVSAAGANHRSQLTARSSESLHVEASPEPEHQNEAAQQRNELPEPAEKPENEHQVVNPAPAPPTVSTKTFALVGGTVTFKCTPNVISLVSATPNSGFNMKTKIETEHGGQQIKVEFESATHESEIKASCVGGQVQAREIKEESRDESREKSR